MSETRPNKTHGGLLDQIWSRPPSNPPARATPAIESIRAHVISKSNRDDPLKMLSRILFNCVPPVPPRPRPPSRALQRRSRPLGSDEHIVPERRPPALSRR